MKSYLHLIWHNPSMPKYPSECTGGQIKNFHNTLDRAWNEIRSRMKNRQKVDKAMWVIKWRTSNLWIIVTVTDSISKMYFSLMQRCKYFEFPDRFSWLLGVLQFWMCGEIELFFYYKRNDRVQRDDRFSFFIVSSVFKKNIVIGMI